MPRSSLHWRGVPTNLAEIPRADPRLLGASGRLIFWRHFISIFFKIFGLGEGLAKSLKALVLMADNFWRNSFACENLSLLPPYLRLFHWRLPASYRLALRPAIWLVRPIFMASWYLKIDWSLPQYLQLIFHILENIWLLITSILWVPSGSGQSTLTVSILGRIFTLVALESLQHS